MYISLAGQPLLTQKRALALALLGGAGPRDCIYIEPSKARMYLRLLESENQYLTACSIIHEASVHVPLYQFLSLEGVFYECQSVHGCI